MRNSSKKKIGREHRCGMEKGLTKGAVESHTLTNTETNSKSLSSSLTSKAYSRKSTWLEVAFLRNTTSTITDSSLDLPTIDGRTICSYLVSSGVFYVSPPLLQFSNTKTNVHSSTTVILAISDLRFRARSYVSFLMNVMASCITYQHDIMAFVKSSLAWKYRVYTMVDWETRMEDTIIYMQVWPTP